MSSAHVEFLYSITVVHGTTIVYLGAELKLQSKSKIKAGTSWSVLIKYSDEGNKEDVSEKLLMNFIYYMLLLKINDS